MNGLLQLGCYKLGRVFLTSHDILIAIPQQDMRLRDRYQATGTVKDRRRSGQPRITTRRQDGTLRRLHRRFPFRPATVSARRTVGLRG